MEQKVETGKINKDMLIGEIMERYPETARVFMELGINCIGCHGSAHESFEMGLKGHGMSDDNVNESLKMLNDVVEKEQKKNVESEQNDVEINVTESAAAKIKEFIEKENKTGFRISVIPGGCSGSQYGMELVDSPSENDFLIEEKNVKIFVDKGSLEKFNGSVIDYVEALQGSGFKITNPKAEGGCGCGKSFK